MNICLLFYISIFYGIDNITVYYYNYRRFYNVVLRLSKTKSQHDGN